MDKKLNLIWTKTGLKLERSGLKVDKMYLHKEYDTKYKQVNDIFKSQKEQLLNPKNPKHGWFWFGMV